MNKYQRKKSKSIKRIMKMDKFCQIKYFQAKRIWKFRVGEDDWV